MRREEGWRAYAISIYQTIKWQILGNQKLKSNMRNAFPSQGKPQFFLMNSTLNNLQESKS